MTRTPSTSRRERSEEIKKQFKAKERRRSLAFFGALTVVAAALITTAAIGARNLSHDKGAKASANLQSSSGRGAESAPPWGLPADAAGRVKTAGLTLGQMGTADHYHVHLDVLVDGQPVPLLANIGIDPSSGQMSGLHTHSADGLVHIEAGTKGQPFTLGQLFTEWNVRLTADRLGSLAADKKNTLAAYVNGKKVAGNPAMVRLVTHQEIAIVYGPKNAKIKVPSTFTFSAGE